MIKPHCEHFKADPVLCAWWDFKETEAWIKWFCSRPDWEERVCESKGRRNIPEDALSGPVRFGVED